MPSCTTCHTSKRPDQFSEASKKCDDCKNKVKLKSKIPKSQVQGYNDNNYMVGMFIGEFKGLSDYF